MSTVPVPWVARQLQILIATAMLLPQHTYPLTEQSQTTEEIQRRLQPLYNDDDPNGSVATFKNRQEIGFSAASISGS
jgi:hypothetical protein